MGLLILITNYILCGHTGTELYVRDLALELLRQGHSPAVYTSHQGKISEELSAAGITVTNSLKKLDFHPDIIHGHHRHETSSAILRFPDTPALYICHDHKYWLDIPPLHSHILRYFGVSNLCIERLRNSGVADDKIGRIFNFVDLKRFKPRLPLPAKPQKALVFSNYAGSDTFLPVVADACRQAGLELDVIGKKVGNLVERPEEILGEYDIVFAKAKAAMEAMAVGCAVVLCDFGGVGPMVTSENFASLRKLNFGFQALTESHTPENLLRSIARYEARDAEKVSILLRSCGGLDHAVTEMVDIYGQIIEEYNALRPTRGVMRDISCIGPISRYRLIYGVKKLFDSIPQEKRESISKNRGFDALKRWIIGVLCRRAKRA